MEILVNGIIYCASNGYIFLFILFRCSDVCGFCLCYYGFEYCWLLYSFSVAWGLAILGNMTLGDRSLKYFVVENGVPPV